MRWNFLALLAAAGLACAILAPGQAADPDTTASDEQLLKAAKIGTDDNALLDFFRHRTVSDEARANIDNLIQQLGDNTFKVRQKASTDLVKLGPAVIKSLENALKNPDLEISRRAEECLRQIEEASSVGLPGAAARLLAVRKPPGAVEVLLAYLKIGDEGAAEDIHNALAANARKDGHAHPDLVKALEAKSPAVRAAAAVALVRSDSREHLADVRKLLQDSDPSVRLHTGLALALAKEKAAVPVLINLLAELPAAQNWSVEDMLYRLAEDKAPKETPGKNEDSQKKYRDAWLAWWKDNEEKVDLGKLAAAPPIRGNNMIILLDQGRLLEMDKDKKVLWQIDNLQFPLDASFVGEARVLVAENNGNIVTERNHKGEVQWEKKIAAPVMAQRLPNGNTFIGCRGMLVEVTPDGREVFNYRRPGGDEIMRAKKLPNGQIACVANSRFLLLDPSGNELKNWPIDIHTYGGRIEVLPNGRVLAACYSGKKIAEFDMDGKIVWEVPVPFEQPISAWRISNGNTLVTSMLEGQPAVEVDRTGKVVWEYKTDTRVTRVYRR
ncbi:MAG TPA: HEAT repeat domain-containing protein [Gemmataceae bacterium]|nr:HEAT repeat domain-containing protein [Gemmataceae bacterium]